MGFALPREMVKKSGGGEWMCEKRLKFDLG